MQRHKEINQMKMDQKKKLAQTTRRDVQTVCRLIEPLWTFDNNILVLRFSLISHSTSTNVRKEPFKNV